MADLQQKLGTELRHSACRVGGEMRLQCDSAGYFLWQDLLLSYLGNYRPCNKQNPSAWLMTTMTQDRRKCRFTIIGQWEKRCPENDPSMEKERLARAKRGQFPLTSDRGRKAASEFDRGTDMILVPYLVRVQVGHSFPFMDPFRCRKAVKAVDLKMFACLAHRTRRRSVLSILANGLLPGTAIGESPRGVYFLFGLPLKGRAQRRGRKTGREVPR